MLAPRVGEEKTMKLKYGCNPHQSQASIEPIDANANRLSAT